MCWFRFIGHLSDIYRTFKPLKSTEAYLKHGLPEPKFEEYPGFRVIFRKDIYTEEYLRNLGLNERQKRAINYLKEHNKITTKEYCKIFNVVKDTANRDLNSLLDKNLIKREGSGPKTYYVLATVRYRPIFKLKKKGKKKGAYYVLK